VGLIKHDYSVLRDVFGNLFGDFGIKEIVEGVDYNVHKWHLVKERELSHGRRQTRCSPSFVL
jgi:hypothetical protein